MDFLCRLRNRVRRFSIVTGVFVLLGVILAVSPTVVFADPVQPTGKIDLSGVAPVKFSSPTLVDLDGDGDQEILVGTTDGKVIALNRSGNTLSQLWAYSTSTVLGGATIVRGAISAGDLDKNGTVEVVVPVGDIFSTNTYGGLVVLDAYGNLLWYYRTYDHVGTAGPPDGYSDGIIGAPALGDLDNDGDLEIVFGSFDHRIYVFHHDGTIADGWPQFIRDTIWSSPALADLDDDGFLEIIIGIDTHQEGTPFNTPNGGGLYVYRSNGELVWKKFINQVIYSSPAVGDLDGNGTLEIVHGTGPYFQTAAGQADGHKIYAWDAAGNPLWNGNTSGYTLASPALGDIDGDGKLEIVSNVLDRKAYAWNHDGSSLWTKTPVDMFGKTMELASAPVLADYTGDGKADVFVNIFWEAAILDGNSGNQLTATSFPNNPAPAYVSGHTASDNSSALGDLDGNGTLELVLASADNAGGHAQIVFWDSLVGNGKPAPWPMVGQNPRHTNLYPHRLPLASEIIAHTIPAVMSPGESRDVSITLKNTGTETWTSGINRAEDASTVALGAVGDADPFTSATRQQLPKGTTVAPGQSYTFKFALKSPSQNGYFITDWRLITDTSGKWFGATAKVNVKIGDQPNLQLLTIQGLKAAGLATAPLPNPVGNFTNWPAALILKLTTDKLGGYHMFDSFGGLWYGGNTFPHRPKGPVADPREFLLGPDSISYYVLLGDGTAYGCNTETCTLNFTPAPPTNIQARSFALAVTTDPQEAKNALGVYVLDGFGNVYTGGAAPAISKPSGLPVAQDIFVRIKLKADGKGYYLLDKYGRIWNGGSAPALAPNYTPKTGEDWARDFELTADEKGFYMLDKDGKVYSGGDAPDLTVNIPASGPGIGRDLELVDTRKSSAPSASFTPDGIGIFHENGATGPIQTTISLSNQGATAFQWTASAAWPTPVRMPVVKITPNSGTLNPGAAQPLAVEISGLDGLSNGVYTVDIAVSATGVTGGPQINRTTKLTVLVVDQVHSVNLPQITR
ncbi:MAG: VCBS repeat-containing protein [Caldilineaceae bacterium]|nr:VCBS repeat-containing protein [Caldilineaceae bacterium]